MVPSFMQLLFGQIDWRMGLSSALRISIHIQIAIYSQKLMVYSVFHDCDQLVFVCLLNKYQVTICAYNSSYIAILRIPLIPATHSGRKRPPVGAKRRWALIKYPSGRLESRI